jgi:glucosamine-6-phosphate deaminase
MRLIIRDDAPSAGAYIAQYDVSFREHESRSLMQKTDRINAFGPTETRPFILGLPTGSSPLAVYRLLIEKHKASKISFKNVVTFNMV